MKTKNYLTTIMNAWCYDNELYVEESGLTFAEFMINECEQTDWNWFMEDDKIDNYTEDDLEELKEFLKGWNYLPETD